MDSLVVPVGPVLTFAAVLARVGGMMTCAPFWSHRAAPPTVRATMALALALVLTPPAARAGLEPPAQLLALAVAVCGEFLIGFTFGFVGRVIFSAFETAAHVFGAQIGFALAATVDPSTRAGTTALGVAAQTFGLMLLLAVDGHHWTLAAVARSFAGAPAGALLTSPAMSELILRLSADALAAGVALAAPAVVVLLAVEFALAVAGRAAPQLQVMLLGFPVKIAVGLWVLGASLFWLPGAGRSLLAGTRGALARVLGAL
jgi:flagellar biosynthesis protein FliR